MDHYKIAELIYTSRKEKCLTQKELAQKLNVSDKTISKWENGLGFPDISMLNKLAEILEVNVSEILSGEKIINHNIAGNMRKTKFYICNKCKNIITSSDNVILGCCGNKIKEIIPTIIQEENHKIIIENIEDEIYLTMEHEMQKSHYISFIAYVTMDKLMITKLYPEQSIGVRFKKSGHGVLYYYCVNHGLFAKKI